MNWFFQEQVGGQIHVAVASHTKENILVVAPRFAGNDAFDGDFIDHVAVSSWLNGL